MCLKFGIEDPEQWLEDVPARVFELWQAYYRLEPWGDEAIGLARAASLLSQLVASKCSSDDAPKVLLEVAELMPYDWAWQPKKRDSGITDPHGTLKAMATAKCRPLSTPVHSVIVEAKN